jgi:hypothetical protein
VTYGEDAVVEADTNVRTQNGHIRNDTGDVSRLALAVTSGAGFLMVASGAHKRLLERPQARLCASRGRELSPARM